MTIPQTAPCTAASIKHLYARFATTKSDTYGVVKSQTELYPVNWHMNTGNPKQKLAKTTQCANSPSKHCLNAEVVQVIQITTLGPHGSSDPPNTWHPQGTAKKCHSVSIAWTSGAATATATATEDPHPLLRIQDCRVAVPRSWGTGSRDFVPSVGLTISCREFCRQLRNGKHAVPKNTLSTHPKRTKHMSYHVNTGWFARTASGNVMVF